MSTPVRRDDFVKGMAGLLKKIALREEKTLVKQDIMDIAGQLQAKVAEEVGFVTFSTDLMIVPSGIVLEGE